MAVRTVCRYRVGLAPIPAAMGRPRGQLRHGTSHGQFQHVRCAPEAGLGAGTDADCGRLRPPSVGSASGGCNTAYPCRRAEAAERIRKRRQRGLCLCLSRRTGGSAESDVLVKVWGDLVDSSGGGFWRRPLAICCRRTAVSRPTWLSGAAPARHLAVQRDTAIARTGRRRRSVAARGRLRVRRLTVRTAHRPAATRVTGLPVPLSPPLYSAISSAQTARTAASRWRRAALTPAAALVMNRTRQPAPPPSAFQPAAPPIRCSRAASRAPPL